MSEENTSRFCFFVVIAFAAWFTRLVGKWHSNDAGLLTGIGLSVVIGGMLAGLIASGLAPLGLKDAVMGYIIAVGIGVGGSGASGVVFWLTRRAERIRAEQAEAEALRNAAETPPEESQSANHLTHDGERGE